MIKCSNQELCYEWLNFPTIVYFIMHEFFATKNNGKNNLTVGLYAFFVVFCVRSKGLYALKYKYMGLYGNYSENFNRVPLRFVQ